MPTPPVPESAARDHRRRGPGRAARRARCRRARVHDHQPRAADRVQRPGRPRDRGGRPTLRAPSPPRWPSSTGRCGSAWTTRRCTAWPTDPGRGQGRACATSASVLANGRRRRHDGRLHRLPRRPGRHPGLRHGWARRGAPGARDSTTSRPTCRALAHTPVALVCAGGEVPAGRRCHPGAPGDAVGRPRRLPHRALPRLLHQGQRPPGAVGWCLVAGRGGGHDARARRGSACRQAPWWPTPSPTAGKMDRELHDRTPRRPSTASARAGLSAARTSRRSCWRGSTSTPTASACGRTSTSC